MGFAMGSFSFAKRTDWESIWRYDSLAHSLEARLRRGMAMAATWGLASEGELYGHICFYRRECQQYYEKCRRYWDEGVAGGLTEDQF